MSITTARNQKVLVARRLLRTDHRRAERRFLVEGPGAIREALGNGLLELFATEAAAARHADLVAAAPVTHLVTDEVMKTLSDTVTPQGLVGIAEMRPAAVPDRARLVAVLAYARDPGNAGTILRTADAAGADAVVFPDESVDPYNPKCVRSAAGSHFHLPVVVAGAPGDVVNALRDQGLRIRAATAAGDVDLFDADLSVPTAWVLGNEAHGLPAEVEDAADERVSVPIYGRAESLNLASAAAVCLYASARAQR